MNEPQHGYWYCYIGVNDEGLSADARMKLHERGDYVQRDDYEAVTSELHKVGRALMLRLVEVIDLQAALDWAFDHNDPWYATPPPELEPILRAAQARIEARRSAAQNKGNAP